MSLRIRHRPPPLWFFQYALSLYFNSQLSYTDRSTGYPTGKHRLIPLLKHTIHLITDGQRLRAEVGLVRAIEAAIVGAGGAISHVQLREQVGPDPASDEELLVLGCQLRTLCDKYKVALFVNRNIRIAGDIGADGIHLGKSEDLDELLFEARSEGLRIGYSAHSAAEVRELDRRGFEYFYLSPIFSPLSKVAFRTPLGVEAITECLAQGAGTPIIALGGVNGENAQSCIGAGASGVAVIGSILCRPDPGVAAAELAGSLRGN